MIVKENMYLVNGSLPSFFESYQDDFCIEYHNMEQYMMAHKALLFGDDEILYKILNTTDPAKIKKLGRQVKDFDNNIWNKHKFDIVVNGNKLKLHKMLIY